MLVAPRYIFSYDGAAYIIIALRVLYMHVHCYWKC
jgi:hypothetical protein